MNGTCTLAYCRPIVRMYGCQTCAVITIDPATEYLRVLANHNLSHLYVKEFRRSLGTGVIARMLSTDIRF